MVLVDRTLPEHRAGPPARRSPVVRRRPRAGTAEGRLGCRMPAAPPGGRACSSSAMTDEVRPAPFLPLDLDHALPRSPSRWCSSCPSQSSRPPCSPSRPSPSGPSPRPRRPTCFSLLVRPAQPSLACPFPQLGGLISHRCCNPAAVASQPFRTLDTDQATLADITGDVFTAVEHPDFPGHRVRIKETTGYCDPSVRCVCLGAAPPLHDQRLTVLALSSDAAGSLLLDPLWFERAALRLTLARGWWPP